MLHSPPPGGSDARGGTRRRAGGYIISYDLQYTIILYDTLCYYSFDMRCYIMLY